MPKVNALDDVSRVFAGVSVEDLCQEYWSHQTDMESAPTKPEKRRHRKLGGQVRDELVRRLGDRVDHVLESHRVGNPYCNCARPAAPAIADERPLRARRPRVMYVEQKTDGPRNLNDRGPAAIVQVTCSKSGRTVYFNGKTFQRIKSGSGGNYLCIEDGNEYWISGVKKRGTNRHWAGGGPVADPLKRQ